jgi:hypothetical protein
MKKVLLSLAALATMSMLASDASAFGNGPFQAAPRNYPGPFARLLAPQPLPAFQAAPWYLYWPYNAHFMTPAPLTGAYYAPPTAGGMMVNPYLPPAGK